MRKYPKYKASGIDWLGEIPSDWIVKKYKYGSSTLNGFAFASDKFSDTEGMPLIRIRDLTNDKIETFFIGEYPKSAIIKSGDLLVGMDGDFLLKEWSGPDALLNQRVCKLLPRRNFTSSYLKYIGQYPLNTINELTYFVTVKHLSDNDIKNTTFPIPSLPEQHAIVRFLDYKTGQIDSFIANRQKQIDLLKEQRNSIIDKAILFGLNDKVTSKEYDNIFVKKLPIKWKLSSVRRELMSQNIEQQDGNHGELHPVATDYVDNGIPFVLASDVNNFEVDLLRCKKIPEKIAENLRIGFSKTGDILLTHKGTIGRVGICDTKEYPYIILTPQVTYYRIKRDFIPKFVFYQFQSNVFNEQLKLLSGGGSTRDYVGIVAQRELKLIKPPIDEQIEIVKQIDVETGKLDNLISKYQKQIDLMQEYRTSLISQAVTGKIDVREWQPKKKQTA